MRPHSRMEPWALACSWEALGHLGSLHGPDMARMDEVPMAWASMIGSMLRRIVLLNWEHMRGPDIRLEARTAAALMTRK